MFNINDIKDYGTKDNQTFLQIPNREKQFLC